MRIGELASRCGVTKDTIRHYLALGLLECERDAANGYQNFSEQAAAQLRFIKTSRQLGFSLEDIKAILADASAAHSPCPRVRNLIKERLTETRKTIAELTEQCNRMEASVTAWENLPDGAPHAQSICPLIESQMANQPE